MQEAVLESRASHLDAIRKLEAPLEAARRDALIQDFGLAVLGDLLVAADRQRVLLHLDRQIAVGEAGHRHGDPVGVFASALDVVGRVTGGAVDADELVEHREQTVEADRVAVKGSKIELSHGISSCEATCR